MLIKTYGLYWNPEIIYWGNRGPGNKGRLMGKIEDSGQVVDLWDQIGIYVLYKEYSVVYVGQAYENDLGKRMRDHLKDRHRGRWDSLSWFGMRNVNKDGRLSKNRKGTRQISSGQITSALEAIMIEVIDPPLNRRHEKVKGARFIEQFQEEGMLTDSQKIDAIFMGIVDH